MHSRSVRGAETSSNLPKRSWAKISQVRTLSVERIGDFVEILPPEKVNQLIEGLNEIVGSWQPRVTDLQGTPELIPGLLPAVPSITACWPTPGSNRY